jgi:hypothetical protein
MKVYRSFFYVEYFLDDPFVFGGILDDGNHAWLSSGTKFAVIDVSTGSKIAAWTFGAVFRLKSQ